MPDPSATDSTAPPNEPHADTPQGSVFVRQVPGEDPPAVLMHGFPNDQRIYNRLLPHLPPRRPSATGHRACGGRPERPIQVDGLRAEAAGVRVSAWADRAVSQPKPVTMLARWNNPARLTSRGD
jgi:pimeloyl-ACP methyl ester carboxylesterase